VVPDETDKPPPEQRPGRAARLRASIRRVRTRRWLAEGLPVLIVAAVAAVVLAGVLYTVAQQDERGPRAWAELTLSPDGCSVDATKQLEARGCVRQGRGVYRVVFSADLTRSTVVAGRGSCCLGPIAASIDAPDSVLVVVPRRVRGPIRASVFIP
jgi:hypothetical protein